MKILHHSNFTFMTSHSFLANCQRALVRMAVAEEEFEMRAETFAERGRRLDAPDGPGGATHASPQGRVVVQMMMDVPGLPGTGTA